MASDSIAVRSVAHDARSTPRAGRRLRVATPLATLVVVLLGACLALDRRAAAEPQVQFPAPPKSAREAVNTLVQRRDVVVNYMACGDEPNFLRKVETIDESPG